MAYAATTAVSVVKTREQLEKLLEKHGADQFFYGSDAERAMIAFRMQGWHYRFTVPTKGLSDQGLRSRWRLLFLMIKAKLAGIEAGVTTLEDEFLAHVVMPDGKTAGDWLKPQLKQIYSSGKMPPLLSFGGA